MISVLPEDNRETLRNTEEKAGFFLVESPSGKYKAASYMLCILLRSLFLFWIGENIKLKFLYEDYNCLWQPASQSVWLYLFSMI